MHMIHHAQKDFKLHCRAHPAMSLWFESTIVRADSPYRNANRIKTATPMLDVDVISQDGFDC